MCFTRYLRLARFPQVSFVMFTFGSIFTPLQSDLCYSCLGQNLHNESSRVRLVKIREVFNLIYLRLNIVIVIFFNFQNLFYKFLLVNIVYFANPGSFPVKNSDIRTRHKLFFFEFWIFAKEVIELMNYMLSISSLWITFTKKFTRIFYFHLSFSFFLNDFNIQTL